ncbi:hypothetical protein ACFQDN_22230 [Pseudomonas asuensis]|uniref:Uncharacterized protein n=1 Tax=Pseudomonas asuensis TaxID=1825787 RepID=A0ABQ2H3L7_9PSED|nr:hypothetical protein [Pseudomonas asuensis]GGM25949.1 hypothetical protein GCM10009425_40870 [Pseudomonas asuensis]
MSHTKSTTQASDNATTIDAPCPKCGTFVSLPSTVAIKEGCLHLYRWMSGQALRPAYDFQIQHDFLDLTDFKEFASGIHRDPHSTI